jgi:hypothetical protein
MALDRRPLLLCALLLATGCGEAPVAKNPCGVICPRTAECIFGIDGEARCACLDGYVGDGLTCEPSVPPGCIPACDANADCVAADVCRCREGFAGDGRTCTPVEGPTCTPACDVNADCVSGTCRCRTGFTGDGTLCEATVEPDPCGGCEGGQVCVVEGSVAGCRCPAGSVEQGGVCLVPSDCEGGGGCHPFASCTVVDGARRCRCENGFVGDGFTCQAPATGNLRLTGEIDAMASSQSGPCVGVLNEFRWQFEVALARSGNTWQGTGSSGVFDVSGRVVIDAVAGTIQSKVDVHLWSNSAFCLGRIDFRISTDASTLGSPHPFDVPLRVLGRPTTWSYSTDAATSNAFMGLVEARFVP